MATCNITSDRAEIADGKLESRLFGASASHSVMIVHRVHARTVTGGDTSWLQLTLVCVLWLLEPAWPSNNTCWVSVRTRDSHPETSPCSAPVAPSSQNTHKKKYRPKTRNALPDRACGASRRPALWCSRTKAIVCWPATVTGACRLCRAGSAHSQGWNAVRSLLRWGLFSRA